MSGLRDRRGVLRGWVVFGPDPNSECGLIVDLLARDARTTRALLLHAARQLRADGHTGVWFPYHDPRPWARRVLIRAGFLPRGSDKAILVQALSERAGSAVEHLDHWYLTYGDTDWFHARRTAAPG